MAATACKLIRSKDDCVRNVVVIYFFQRNLLLYTLPLSLLFVNDTTLHMGEQFRYLGVTSSSDATWTAHINATCLKARGLIGMLYRKLYSYTDTQSLLKLYWATPGVCQLGLGSPCTQEGGIEAIECVEKFVLKVCLRDSSHSTLASSLRRHNN